MSVGLGVGTSAIGLGIVNGVNPHYYALISDAKGIASAPEDNTVIFVGGRDSVGDGFEGEFYWDADATDDTYADAISIKATTITTGRWVRVFSGLPHVTWWVGSNDSDVDQDFTDALAYCASNNIKLYVPNGTYALTTNIWDAQDNDLGLIGESWGAIITFKPALAGTTLFKIRGTRWEFANLRFLGNSAEDPRKGIIFELGNRDTTTELDRSSFRNIWFEDVKAAFYADYTWILTITDCWFQRCESALYTDANAAVLANSIAFVNCHCESNALLDNHVGVKGILSGFSWLGGVVEGYGGTNATAFDFYAPSKGLTLDADYYEDNTTDIVLGTTRVSGYVTGVQIGAGKGGNSITLDYAKGVVVKNTQRTDTNAARPMLLSANTGDVRVDGLLDSAYMGYENETGTASTTLGAKKESVRVQRGARALWADWIRWDIATVSDGDYLDTNSEVQIVLAYDSNYTRSAETTEYITGIQSMKLTRVAATPDVARQALYWRILTNGIAKLPRRFCVVMWVYNPSATAHETIRIRTVGVAAAGSHAVDRTVASANLYEDYWMPLHVEVDLDYYESQIVGFAGWTRFSIGLWLTGATSDTLLIDHLGILPGYEPVNLTSTLVGPMDIPTYG